MRKNKTKFLGREYEGEPFFIRVSLIIISFYISITIKRSGFFIAKLFNRFGDILYSRYDDISLGKLFR